MLLKDCTYLDKNFSFKKGDIRIEDGIICMISSHIDPKDNEQVINVEYKRVIPGLIDVHSHGALGFEANDGDVEGIKKIADYLASNGITSFLASTGGGEDSKLVETMKSIKWFMEEQDGGATVIGIHSEGPYISKDKCGAMKKEYMYNPSIEHFNMLNNASGNNIKIITIAPELDGAETFVKALPSHVKPSIGHTCATFDQTKEAIEWGCRRVTHMYNAMPSYTHREPGVVGAVFDSDIMMEIISDGYHVHPAVIRNTVRTAGYERIILISDMVKPTGLPDGTYTEPWEGGRIKIVSNGKITLPNGTLAGSGMHLMDDVRRFHEFGNPLEMAVMCASYNPAKNLGIENERGSIDEGKIADIVILNDDLSIESVYVKGKLFK